MKTNISHSGRVKTQQQPDSTWKAWVVDLRMEVYALTEEKAIEMIEMILSEGEQDHPNDGDARR